MHPRTRRVSLAALLAAVRVAVLAALLVAACGPAGSPSAALPSGPATSCPEPPPPAQADIPAWSPSAQDPSVFPVIVSSGGSLACGPSRVMFSFLDDQNRPVAAPDRPASVAFYDLAADPETPVSEVDGTFVWAIEDAVGIYAATVAFTSAGLWGAEFTTTGPDGGEERIRIQFDVQPRPLVVAVGDPAPSVDSTTLADVDGDIARLSTDDEPVERFYETSIADALAAGEPFVLVFATPKFCASAQCGPTLDRIKPVVADHPDLTVINVEPYELQEVDGQLQPVLSDGQLTLVEAARAWRLLSEPWVFVVDADGIVSASFEGILSAAELEAAIVEVAGG